MGARARAVAVCLIMCLGMACLTSCGTGKATAMLRKAAKTNSAATERRAFRYINRNFNSYSSVRFYAEDGHQLFGWEFTEIFKRIRWDNGQQAIHAHRIDESPPTGSEPRIRTVVLEVRRSGRVIRHRVIDEANILVLMYPRD